MSEQRRSEADLDQAKAMWGMGDYEKLTSVFDLGSDDFIARLDAAPPGQALDIACGTGSTALPLARLGFEVTGLDLSPRMLDVARGKARDQGLAIRFDEGVAEAMPYADASFDIAVSMFGIMFSPKPRAAAMEVARVLKPGGRLEVASWTSDGFTARMGGVFASHMPPEPADGATPIDWSDADRAREMLEAHFERIETHSVPVIWRVDLPPAQAARIFLDNAGPPQFMLKSMTEDGRGRLEEDFARFWTDNNRSSDPSITVVENDYLAVSAVRREVTRANGGNQER